MHKPRLVPIIDHKELVRDTYSKAILPTNLNALQEHRLKKKAFEDLMKQSSEIKELKEEMSEIKSMLHQLLKDK
jgi:hypothetical protein